MRNLCLVVREGESGESEVRRAVRYPDSHQLFVGNVPHDVDKTELKEFFEREFSNAFTHVYFLFTCAYLLNLRCVEYGTVLELRINSGGKLPNFGFVVFDDSEPVQKILSNRVRSTLCHVLSMYLTNADDQTNLLYFISAH